MREAISITKKSCQLDLQLPNGLSSLRSLEVTRLQAEDDQVLLSLFELISGCIV